MSDQQHAPAALYPRERRDTHFTGGWVGGRSGRENFVPTGIRSRTVQPVVSRYTDWGTRPTAVYNNNNIYLLKLGCHPVAVFILHVNKAWNLVTTKFKLEGLHEKHVVATWNLGNHLSICFWAQGNQEKPVSKWPVAGPSEYWPVASSPAFKLKKYTHSTTNTHKITTHTSQLQQYTRSTNNNYPKDNLN